MYSKDRYGWLLTMSNLPKENIGICKGCLHNRLPVSVEYRPIMNGCVGYKTYGMEAKVEEAILEGEFIGYGWVITSSAWTNDQPLVSNVKKCKMFEFI